MAEKKPSYWEQLRDPRWQKKRLEILNRDGWECLNCGDKTKTLNVHHGYYRRGNAPWDYPDKSLHTLCESCHEQTEASRDRLYGFIGFIPTEIERLIGYVKAVMMHESEGAQIAMKVRGHEEACGMADVYRLTAEQVLSVMKEDGFVHHIDLLKVADRQEPSRGSECKD